MSNSKHIKRNEKIKLVKMLKALNYIYSLRHLESLLDVPYQNIWRYINMIAIPSDDVAVDIINKLSNMKIIDKTISEIANKYKDNVYGAASDIGFLSIYALKIEEVLEDVDINIVLPISDYAIPFASILAWELGAKICIPSFSRKIKDTKIKAMWYYSLRSNELELFVLPKTCSEENTEIFLVDVLLNDVEKFKTVLLLLKSSNTKVKGLATVYINNECLDYANKNVLSLVLYAVLI